MNSGARELINFTLFPYSLHPRRLTRPHTIHSAYTFGEEGPYVLRLVHTLEEENVTQALAHAPFTHSM
uniref:Uncharacterized protein n=1 Tax=Anguilla anguilla TaxID=7936 RepID=A0A0E9SJ25_ANGAN